MKKRGKILSFLAAVTLLTSMAVQPAVSSAASSAAQMEYLDRGTVAVYTGSGVYLSWRLLCTENYDTEFDVYRDGGYVATVSNSTNYTDPKGTKTSTYQVVQKGGDVAEGTPVWENQYLTIPLDRPEGGVSLDGDEYTYSPNDVTPADVDGDGQYELILKWEPSNSFDSGKSANHNGNVYIDCYELSGEKLWRIDMGININAGAHFTQIAAYDFDLDGKAELAMKTAPGTKDGKGSYVSSASLIDEIKNTDNTADYRHSEGGVNDTGGRVMSGPEFYTVFQGDTGAALDTVYYPHPRGTVREWGDNWGNRSERYLAGVAYLDGKTPSMLAWRGYYAKTTVTAYNLVDKKLVQVADFDTSKNGNGQFAGNGNHNLTVGDVDGDGCDEVLCGSLALDNDLSVLWCSGRGHGDALHLADYDPTHDGLEYFSVHEDYGGGEITGSTTGNDGQQHRGGMTLYKAENGEELFHVDSDSDQGRGMMANVGYGEGYFELWGSGNYVSYGDTDVRESDYRPDSANQRVFWDGDVYDELFDGTGSSDSGNWAKISDNMGRITTLKNVTTNNGTKNNAGLIADILGDWREEIVMRGQDDASLVVYTTTIPTEYKLYTLMHDRAYRMQVACQNAGYNQPPHISYYISENNDEYDARKTAAYVKTVHDGVTEVRTGNLPADKDITKPTPVPSPTPTPTPTPDNKPPTPASYFTFEDGVITGYSGNFADVVIPNTINGKKVTALGESLFSKHTELKSIYIPEDVTEIQYGVFWECTNLNEVVLPKSLILIDNSAFRGCKAIENIDFPDSLTQIGDSAFGDCTSLKKVDTNNVEKLGTTAFYGCTALEEIILREKLVLPGNRTFWECGNIKKIKSYNKDVFPSMAKNENAGMSIYGYIGSLAEKVANKNGWKFYPLDGFALEMTATENGVEIANNRGETVNAAVYIAQYESGTLINVEKRDIAVPMEGYVLKNVPEGTTVFLWNDNQEPLADKITIKSSPPTPTPTPIPTPTPTPGVLPTPTPTPVPIPSVSPAPASDFSVSNGVLTRYTGSDENVSVPSSVNGMAVTKIGERAFEDNETLKYVILPDSVTTVDSYAFWSCSNLEGITLPKSLKTIGEYAFNSCNQLQSVSLPDTMTEISVGAFSNCGALASVKLPSGLKTIGNRAFRRCGFAEIDIPKTVTSIGSEAFSDNENLVSVTIPARVKALEDSTFSGCETLSEITLPEGLRTIGSSAFAGCSSLEHIDLPESVREIGNYAFGNSHITYFDSKNVEKMGSQVFRICPQLKEVVYREKLAEVGAGSYYYDSIEKATVYNREISENLPPAKMMYGYADSGAEMFALTNKIPFYDIETGEQITKEWVVDENGVLRAYYGTEAGALTVPSEIDGIKITAIGDEVFMDCVMESVSLPEGITSIGIEAFDGCGRMKNINIPDTVTEIGSYAFTNCSSLESVTLPEGVKTIEKVTFVGCDALKEINLDFVETIDYRAFVGCGALTEITLGENLSELAKDAFSDCAGLVKVTVKNADTVIEDGSIPANPGMQMYGYAGSTARIYANMNDIPFYDIQTGKLLPPLVAPGE